MTKSNIDQFRINNFDLLRLIAALQVVFGHSIELTDLSLEGNYFFQFIHAIPGVPLFFFISGFLISKSYEVNPNIKNYAINRGLRIFPGLWFCFIISIMLVYLSGYNFPNFSLREFSYWSIGQLSFIHFYHPEFMNDFGIGVLNGSLWTIGIELQFYIITPFIYHFFLGNEKKTNRNLFILIIIFLFINFWFYHFRADYKELLWYKLLGVTFTPYFYMFLVGVFFQKNFCYFYKYLNNKGIMLFFLYIGYAFILYCLLNVKLGNGIGPWLFFPLACLVFSLAYSSVNCSKKLLRHQDISYGIYIYHMSIVNTAIYLFSDWRFSNEIYTVTIIMISTILFATFSWFFIEKTSLAVKKKAFFPIEKNKSP